jgi:hypothetical protein
MDTSIDGPEQPIHLVIGRQRRLVELQALAVLHIDAVEAERVDVDVQIQRSAEALNDRHRPAPALVRTRVSGAASQNTSTARTKTQETARHSAWSHASTYRS